MLRVLLPFIWMQRESRTTGEISLAQTSHRDEWRTKAVYMSLQVNYMRWRARLCKRRWARGDLLYPEGSKQEVVVCTGSHLARLICKDCLQATVLVIIDFFVFSWKHHRLGGGS